MLKNLHANARQARGNLHELFFPTNQTFDCFIALIFYSSIIGAILPMLFVCMVVLLIFSIWMRKLYSRHKLARAISPHLVTEDSNKKVSTYNFHLGGLRYCHSTIPESHGIACYHSLQLSISCVDDIKIAKFFLILYSGLFFWLYETGS